MQHAAHIFRAVASPGPLHARNSSSKKLVGVTARWASSAFPRHGLHRLLEGRVSQQLILAVGPGGGCFERWCSVRQRLFQKASLQARGARRIRARTLRSHRPARRRRFHDLGLDWVRLFWGVGCRILG